MNTSFMELATISNREYVMNLADASLKEKELVGSKAAHLGELSDYEYHVPKGFILTTAVYDFLLESENLGDTIARLLNHTNFDDAESVERYSDSICEAITEAHLENKILALISEKYQEMNLDAVAVRSSATAEDLPESSFAGQYETFLNIKNQEQVAKALVKCYQSMWSPRVISYRQRNGIDHLEVKLAILIQETVDAKAAGVLFTRDPTSTKSDRIVIESNFGLGESVVSGQAIPDRFVLEKEQPSKVESFGVKETQIGIKGVVVKPLSQDGEGGITAVNATSNESETPSITNHQAIELARIGKELESIFGSPQDIEWAIDEDDRICILQSRPITTSTKDDEEEILWTRGYSDDYWNDNVTPLFFDLLGDQLTYIVNKELNSIMGYKDMPDELLKLHKAHVYFNLDVLREKVRNEIPPFIRSEDVLNYFPDGDGPYGKETMREMPFNLLGRLMAEIRVMLYDPRGSLTETAESYDQWTSNVFIPYCREFDSTLKSKAEEATLKDLMHLADELDREMMTHFRMVRYGIPVHNIGMNLLTKYLLGKFLGRRKAGTYYPLLISGLEHKTNEINKEVNKLAEIAVSSPKIREVITEYPSESLYNHLQEKKHDSVKLFMSAFDEFLQEFGERGFTREPFYPRWGEAPEYVFDILKSLVRDQQTTSTSHDPKRRRIVAENKVRREIKAQRFGRIKWELFSTILGFARRYIKFREDQRFNLDRWITRNRAVFLEMGYRMKKQNIIPEASRIFFFHRKEIRKIVYDELSDFELAQLAETIEERFHEFKSYEDTTPPKFLKGNREYNDAVFCISEGGILTGIPASHGRVSGPVRVLETVNQVPQVRQGEILIVPRTDPGWTPVFSKIAGVVTETGGLLSHGAVVSREFGIPAVTNISRACKLVTTGQMVTIDGYKGEVIIHNGD
ncbi:MAG: hypothetical protein GF309_05270 [Candidatus Lokiarchaeota archaeon]|nr:hypothetical protein [Candidatus Lokiarchaeota archaeon]